MASAEAENAGIGRVCVPLGHQIVTGPQECRHAEQGLSGLCGVSEWGDFSSTQERQGGGDPQGVEFRYSQEFRDSFLPIPAWPTKSDENPGVPWTRLYTAQQAG